MTVPSKFAAVVWQDTEYSPERFADLVARAAGGLARIGVGPGDGVGLVLRNCVEALVADQAVRRIGAYPVAVNWHDSPDEVAFVLRDAGVRVAVAHGDLWPAGVEVPVIGIPMADVDLPAGQVASWAELLAGPPYAGPRGSAETIIYTSGTTGRPKGVRKLPVTGEQRARARAMRDLLYGITDDARVLVVAPLYHAAPLQMAQHTIERGELLVLHERFDAERFLAAVEKYAITHTFLVPTMFGRVLGLPPAVRDAHDVSSLRFVLHAGAPCPPSLKRRMIEEWGPVVHEYYGSTELGPVSFATPADWCAHPGTVGRPLPGVGIAFLDPGSGLPGGTQPAELAVSTTAFGDFTYEGLPERRAELQAGAFVATGDVGYVEDGYLYLSDRVRDLVISGGVNLYPAEIEAVIQELPGVADCAVFGVPDDDLGEVLAALVEPSTMDPVRPDELARHFAARLGRLKHPRVVEFRDSIPREPNGKVRKRLLRAEFATRMGRRDD